MVKIIRGVFPLLASFCVFASCVGGSNSNKPQNENTTAVTTTQEVKRAMDTVKLSFGGFTLGGSFSEGATALKQDKKTTVLKEYTNEYLVDYIEYLSEFPNYNSPNEVFPIQVYVYAFSGRVFKIEVVSSDYFAVGAFTKMYIAKYGDDGASGKKHSWRFGNSQLKLSESTVTVQKKELIPERANLNLRNIDNYYRTTSETVSNGVDVMYLEHQIISEYEAYQKHYWEAQDSLKRVQKEKLAAQRQEELKELEKAQQEIVSKTSF